MNVGIFTLEIVSFWIEGCSQLDVKEAHFGNLQFQWKNVRPEQRTQIFQLSYWTYLIVKFNLSFGVLKKFYKKQ